MPQAKRSRRKEARPEEIIDAALAEFAAVGYSAASMAQIAARAGIARSTIYLYYADKEALISAAFDLRLGQAFAAAGQGVALSSGPFREVFHEMLTLLYTRIVKSDALVLLKVLVAEGRQFPQLLTRYHDTALNAAMTMLTGLLKQGLARGELRPDVMGYDIKLVMSPIMLAAIWHLTFQELEPIDLAHYIEGHVSFICDGILTR
ncbi:TetR/AcrR family transcriptional regulator [uncultured Lentibacter sp.]|jgi:AcrR family transcriptional regulator|uniref:TetR/AcrR family transcriptional regulator n=1 Tax=uncultured Lentibacter sp. TaxID=1659309 RepID=UPI0026310648|nr:TetR/AcrR family transcriptional regulator [uncultured Lentibacter sp.]